MHRWGPAHIPMNRFSLQEPFDDSSYHGVPLRGKDRFFPRPLILYPRARVAVVQVCVHVTGSGAAGFRLSEML